MRVTRVHADIALEPGSDCILPAATTRHVARVLRMRAGADLIVFNGSGYDYRCKLTNVEGREARVRVLERMTGLGESPLGLKLVQAVSRGERMDWTLQKAVELGVHEIAPVLSSRCVVRLDDRQVTNRMRHWEGVVASACEQSGRSMLPILRPPTELKAYLAQPASAGTRLVLSPSGPASLAGLSTIGKHVELLVGPEGGLDEHEIAAAADTGFKTVRLGPRILRTETAGIAALAVIQALWGDLQ